VKVFRVTLSTTATVTITIPAGEVGELGQKVDDLSTLEVAALVYAAGGWRSEGRVDIEDWAEIKPRHRLTGRAGTEGS
jgi:hypothetical protein